MFIGFATLVVGGILFGLQKPEPVSLTIFLEQTLPWIIEKIKVEATVDFSDLPSEQTPAELNNVELMLPHYQNFDYSELNRLFRFSEDCTNSKGGHQVSPELRKAWAWVRFTCLQSTLPKNFFKEPPYLFPTGRSFASLAEDLHFDFANYLLPDEIKTFRSLWENIEKTSIGAELNLQQASGLVAGEEILVGKKSVFIRRREISDTQRGKVYLQVSRDAWDRAIQQQEFYFSTNLGAACVQRASNGCWLLNEREPANRRAIFQRLVAGAIVLLLALISGLYAMDRKRRAQMRERQRFTLQMLTHELRTPTATLSLLLESIRADFDFLKPQQQLQFLKMANEISRLKNTTQMSYAYLQTDSLSHSRLRMNLEPIELNAFVVDFLASDEFENVEFAPTSRPITVEGERSWLALCLSNLIRNAIEHGLPPIKVILSESSRVVGITVQDGGQLQGDSLNDLARPFQKSSFSKGLGLGLSILRQVAHEMNGYVEVHQRPTRFSLSLRRPS